MLGWRLAVSFVLVPLLAAVFWVDARSGTMALPLLGLALLLSVRSCWELTKLLNTRQMSPSFPWTAVCSALVVLASWLPHLAQAATPDAQRAIEFAMGAAFAVSVIILLAASAWRYEAPGRTMEQLSSELFVVAYAGLLLAVTAQLRWIAGGKFAYVPLASLVIAVKAGDIGGYTIGRLFGRRKMSPRLSPGKTWAGFFGAIGGAAIGSALWLIGAANYYSDSWFCVYLAIAFGMTMGLVGLLGDLCESLIKRDVGQKDAAALFPGFGGLLDLLDSVVYAGPIAWLWWSLFPPLK